VENAGVDLLAPDCTAGNAGVEISGEAILCLRVNALSNSSFDLGGLA